MLKSYLRFSEELLIESLRETIVYYSPNLLKLFKTLDSDISRDLMGLEGNKIKDDITFIDISDLDGYITFTTSKNALKNLENDYPKDNYSFVHDMFDVVPRVNNATTLYSNDHISWTKSRNPMKIGRFINKILPKYSTKEIEDYTNKFKSYQKGENIRFVIVEGDDISKFYNYENYALDKHTLSSSCMKSVNSSYFEIYVKNPEVCKMLVLFDNFISMDKIVGRALLWKPFENSEDFEFEYFMDRQYAASDSYIDLMRSFADKKGWSIKLRNSYDSEKGVIFGDFKGGLDMSVQLNNIIYSNFPYVDTFKIINPDTKVLINQSSDDAEDGMWSLTSTQGEYSVIGREMVFSEWFDTEIYSDESVYSSLYNDNFPSNRAIRVNIGSIRNRDWYPEGSDDLVYCDWYDEYINVEDSVYSEIYDSYLLDSDAESVVNWIKNDGNCNADPDYVHSEDSNWIRYRDLEGIYWFYILYKMYSNYRQCDGVLSDQLDEDWQGDYIPKNLSVITYKIKGEDFWITEEDNDVLKIGYELDKDDMRKSDIISYISDLMDFNLYDKLINKLDELGTTLSLDKSKIFKKFGDSIIEYPFGKMLY